MRKSPTGFEPMTSQTPGERPTFELRKTYGERRHLIGSYLRSFLHTARISNVWIVLYDEGMRDGETNEKMK